jgi:hypothetical protein
MMHPEANDINWYVNYSAEKKPPNNATLPTHPAVIDWKVLSEFMASIMQSLHEQYKQNL